jgi:hypothetical protein
VYAGYLVFDLQESNWRCRDKFGLSLEFSFRSAKDNTTNLNT